MRKRVEERGEGKKFSKRISTFTKNKNKNPNMNKNKFATQQVKAIPRDLWWHQGCTTRWGSACLCKVKIEHIRSGEFSLFIFLCLVCFNSKLILSQKKRKIPKRNILLTWNTKRKNKHIQFNKEVAKLFSKEHVW